MTITQTVEIPADRRITLEVPREVPTGRAKVEFNVIPFVPASKTDNPRFNAKALAAMEEGKAIMSGEKKVKWHKPNELDSVWNDILHEDSDD